MNWIYDRTERSWSIDNSELTPDKLADKNIIIISKKHEYFNCNDNKPTDNQNFTTWLFMGLKGLRKIVGLAGIDQETKNKIQDLFQSDGFVDSDAPIEIDCLIWRWILTGFDGIIKLIHGARITYNMPEPVRQILKRQTRHLIQILHTKDET